MTIVMPIIMTQIKISTQGELSQAIQKQAMEPKSWAGL